MTVRRGFDVELVGGARVAGAAMGLNTTRSAVAGRDHQTWCSRVILREVHKLKKLLRGS